MSDDTAYVVQIVMDVVILGFLVAVCVVTGDVVSIVGTAAAFVVAAIGLFAR